MEGYTPHCAINKNLSEYYISCVDDSIITVSNPEMEIIIFEKFPRFETLCRILSEQLLTRSQSSLDEFKIFSPEQRYINLQQSKHDLFQRVSQHQLASYLGIAPQSLSRLKARISKKNK